jgi:hypothetical protein
MHFFSFYQKYAAFQIKMQVLFLQHPVYLINFTLMIHFYLSEKKSAGVLIELLDTSEISREFLLIFH